MIDCVPILTPFLASSVARYIPGPSSNLVFIILIYFITVLLGHLKCKKNNDKNSNTYIFTRSLIPTSIFILSTMLMFVPYFGMAWRIIGRNQITLIFLAIAYMYVFNWKYVFEDCKFN
jgi:hypothetical protein